MDEAFHASFDIKNKFVQRWGVLDNVTEEILGSPGEGTSIDYDEPFIIRFVFHFYMFLNFLSDLAVMLIDGC